MNAQQVYQLESLPKGCRLAVIGNPISHSKSPFMHEAALEEAALYHQGIADYNVEVPAGSRYVRLLCETEGELFEDVVRSLQRRGFIGVNITIPFKKRAYDLADVQDSSATQAKAANTLLFTPDGRIHAYNTDNDGFIAALCEFMGKKEPHFAQHRLMILGACGGAGSAIALRCAEYGFQSIMLVNRPRPELAELATSLGKLAPECQISTLHFDSPDLEDLVGQCDIIVNASSLGLNRGDLLPIPPQYLRRGSYYYDIITHETPLSRAARELGCHVSTGEGMLLWQGVLAFRLWFEQGVGRPLAAWFAGEELPNAHCMREALLSLVG